MLNSPLWPAWLAVAIAALLTINQLISESEKFANSLGRVGRKLYERARTRRRMDTVEFNVAVREAVKAERKSWEDDEAREMKVMEGRLQFVTEITEEQQKQLREITFELRCHRAYGDYEGEWHNKLRIMALRAANNGGEIAIDALPPHLMYSEFEEHCQQRDNMRWREWGII